MNDLTQILEAAGKGDPQAAAQLLPLIYEDLRRLAAARMAREAPGQTLQATALVHEAWLRLAHGGQKEWNGRAHFFGAAAEAMRRILIERARRRKAQRHGGGSGRVNVEDVPIAAPADDDELLDVHAALDRLAALEPDKAEVVKLKYFVGLTNAEAAEVLGVSEPTVKRYWTFARAWLFREIRMSHTQG